MNHEHACECGRNLAYPAEITVKTIICRCGKRHLKKAGITYKAI